MLDLSPSQYGELVTRVKANEADALNYLTRAAHNDVVIGDLTSCDTHCRELLACNLDYAVNEFTMLCRGYEVDYSESFLYFLGAL